MSIKKILVAGLVVLACWACEETVLEPEEVNIGFDFFPTEVGLFRIYQVEDISVTLVEGEDTTSFQIMEEISEGTLAQNGDSLFIVNSFSRATENDPWLLDSVWSIRRTPLQGITNQRTTTFVSLIFPVEEGRTWDGNALNANNFDEYRMENVSQSFEVQNNLFDSTLTVIQEDNQDTLVNLDRRIEIFAENIGPIYREFTNLRFNTEPNNFGLGIIEEGRSIRFEIIAYGEE